MRWDRHRQYQRPPRRGVRVALTILQPWLWAICHAGKRLENRGWRPKAEILRLGEWFALHAGKNLDCAPAHLAAPPYFLDQPVPALEDLPMGSILAVARYAGAQSLPPARDHEQRRWWVGPHGWGISDVLILSDPIPARGKQGLWPLSAPERDEVQRQARQTLELREAQQAEAPAVPDV